MCGINAQKNWTPLHAAARQGHIAVVQTLINLGANLSCTDLVRRQIAIAEWDYEIL